jgi:uncharacterized membrane protein (UPF0182 family)
MPDPAQPIRRPAGTRRRGRVLLPTLVVIGVVLVTFGLFTNFWTDWLWYSSIDYRRVFTTELTTKALLFLVFGVLMAAAVAGNMWLAYRNRPVYPAVSPEQQNLERYRQGVEPFRKILVIGVPALFGLLAGSSAASEWETFLLWRNGEPFGERDPQFGRDLSFFIFDYPWWRFLISFAFGVIVLSLLASVVAHYLYGGIRLQTPGDRTTRAARIQIAVLLGLFVLFKAAAYWLDRYGLAVKEGELITGLTYTDVNAVLPAKTILVFIALICAVLFFVSAFQRGWLWPLAGLGLMVISAIIIGGVYPAIVQQFQVRPSEASKEAPYIQRNIDSTRESYDIADADVTEYAAETDVAAGQLRADAETIPGIRLQDPSRVSTTFQQLQQIRGFYRFPDPLDIDRYTIDGEKRDVVVAVREVDLAGVPQDQRNWINDHAVYTHGFGFVSAYGNTRTAEGEPDFNVRNIPPQGDIGEFEPRVYFGERSPTYSIVGGAEGSRPQELDFPDESGTGQTNNTYQGEGGVPVGSLFNRLLYAVKFQEGNILLSNFVNSESKILYEREPRERIEKVAPWLTLDGDPYPAVVDGRIVYIVDGYTTSNDYPYAARRTLEETTEDSVTATSRTGTVVAQAPEEVNYIRNSVKATVDAYDGTVTLYEWDQNDPVLKAWRKTFPGTVQDREDISDELLQHLRYPEDLFKVQRELLSRYHVTDPQAYYGGQDFWKVPPDPTTTAGDQDQPPYYLTLQMPGQEAASFSLTSTFTPAARPQLSAFMSVNADPASGEDYGKMRVLRLPRNTTVPGPGQVQNQFDSDPEVSSQLNLLRRGNSEVVSGNLLTIPVGGGLLYVEPVYVRAAGGESYPLLRKVLVAFGDRVAFNDTLQLALDDLFEGESGTDTEETTPTPPPADGTTPPPPAPGGATNPNVQAALAEAQAALAAADEALRAGDFTAYGQAQAQLRAAIERALAAEVAAGGTATPAPTETAAADNPGG